MWELVLGLALQVAGLAVAAWIVVALIGRPSWGRAAAAVALALLASTFVMNARNAARALGRLDAPYKLIPTPDNARTFCVNEPSAPNFEFVKWLRTEIPGRVPYLFVAPETDDIATAQCTAFILYPRVQTYDEARAQFVVFNGPVPPRWAARVRAAGRAYRKFAPELSLLDLTATRAR